MQAGDFFTHPEHFCTETADPLLATAEQIGRVAFLAAGVPPPTRVVHPSGPVVVHAEPSTQALQRVLDGLTKVFDAEVERKLAEITATMPTLKRAAAGDQKAADKVIDMVTRRGRARDDADDED